MPPDPALRDAEVVLRPSREDDVPAIREVYSEPDTRRWMGWGAELPDDAEARANIARAASAWEDGTWAVFRIADADSDEVIGGINLRFGENDTAEISYFLRTSARGRGIATRAARLVVRWAFEELGIERIEFEYIPTTRRPGVSPSGSVSFGKGSSGPRVFGQTGRDSTRSCSPCWSPIPRTAAIRSGDIRERWPRSAPYPLNRLTSDPATWMTKQPVA